MSSSKARSLRERMSIDPDAPEPVARPRRPRSAPTPDPTPERAESASAGEQPVAAEQPIVADPPSAGSEPSASSAGSTPPPDPDASVTPAPPPSSAASAAATSSEPAPAVATSPTEDPPAPTRSTSPSRSSSRRSTRRKGRDDLGWTSALDDPSVSSGGNGYRSFYVSDEVFARFRAAIYWTARRPDATDVPDNMSAGVEDYMDQVASDLERRFNGKNVFPPTPDQLKAHRRREGGR